MPETSKSYSHLGPYSDLVTAAKRLQRRRPLTGLNKESRQLILQSLVFNPFPLQPQALRVERRWTRDGVDGQLLTWSVGYGPRTEAWLLRPAGEAGKLPGIVALHDHGGFKYWGKEKIAIGPGKPAELQSDWFDCCYGGKAFANELARRGFCVLVHDVFTWGSRRFPLSVMPEWDRSTARVVHRNMPMESNPPKRMPGRVSQYAWAANFHENTVQKYCVALGTNMSAVVAYEDRLAANFLAGRKDVVPGGVGCIGLSGGGLRATLLHATSRDIRAAVVVGMMSTYDGLLDHNIVSHTWMLYPDAALSRAFDWSDLTVCRAPIPLMVQYNRGDPLFTLPGMKRAHHHIRNHYKALGCLQNYVGRFYEGVHKFDGKMQASATEFMKKHLEGASKNRKAPGSRHSNAPLKTR